MDFYYNSPLIEQNIYIRYWNNDKTKINFEDNYNIFISNKNSEDNFTIEEKGKGILYLSSKKYRFKYYNVLDISDNIDNIINNIINKTRRYEYISIYTDNPINVIYLYTQIIKTLSNATLNDIIDDINANYYYRIDEYESNIPYILYSSLKAKGRKCKQSIYIDVDDKYVHLLPETIIEFVSYMWQYI
jgi:hypothetical protein